MVNVDYSRLVRGNISCYSTSISSFRNGKQFLVSFFEELNRLPVSKHIIKTKSAFILHLL